MKQHVEMQLFSKLKENKIKQTMGSGSEPRVTMNFRQIWNFKYNIYLASSTLQLLIGWALRMCAV